ncbi:hypothetical protein [Burkholderia ubonensis]|uniref:Uncharacterized protein n=1 Tax=Burkholderia ubonensis subsp. mesacidophila TaxID=265293 RepID=A0A2A4FBJ1_9BURK|nr:hypothetical protein [Burkholderia ubonensis]PCE30040.1 hypothetical protein BZL54_23025 [Burkholderia ubonensis subsp. mesacidophila]
MTEGRSRRSSAWLLVAWSGFCALLATSRFPHFLIVCEAVEATFGNSANDAVVSRVMLSMVACLWAVGCGAFIGRRGVRGRTRTRSEANVETRRGQR